MMTINRNGCIYQILMNISITKQLESEELLRRSVIHIVTQNWLPITGKKKKISRVKILRGESVLRGSKSQISGEEITTCVRIYNPYLRYFDSVKHPSTLC